MKGKKKQKIDVFSTYKTVHEETHFIVRSMNLS